MPETPESIRAGTMNLARLMPETLTRAKAIATEIDSMSLDLIGFQETEEWIEDKLVDLLQGSWLVASDHVNCPTMIRSDKFERVIHNGQSNIKITMPGSVRSRYGSAALLRRKSDGLVFVFANIHPSNTGEFPGTGTARLKMADTNRIRQAESCWAHLEAWGVTGFPMLIVGDMNDKSMPPAGIPGVFARHGLADVLQKLDQPARIDRAFVKGFSPVTVAVNPVRAAVSDHDFVTFVVSDIDTTPLHGNDVASWQGQDWKPEPGDAFAFVKCSEGTSYANPYRDEQLATARAAGLVVGHYHFMVKDNPLEQARYFVDKADIQPGDLLVADWEGDWSAGKHPTVEDAAAFIAEVKRLKPGHKVLLYCNRSDWTETTVKAPDGLWISEYGVNAPAVQEHWRFWQYSDKPIDRNWSRFTTIEALKAWAGGTDA
jgi:GH25 family lysozyme M1 (1,4-beta-N-acetylmuramidase)